MSLQVLEHEYIRGGALKTRTVWLSRAILCMTVITLVATLRMPAQTFAGGGLAGVLPTTQLAPVTQFGIQGFGQYGIRRLWPVCSFCGTTVANFQC